jgi:hypothetical protein
MSSQGSLPSWWEDPLGTTPTVRKGNDQGVEPTVELRTAAADAAKSPGRSVAKSPAKGPGKSEHSA